jgi:hypothetical protein
VVQDLPNDVTHAREEVRLPSGVISDVVLYRGETAAAAIEVLVSSRVGREKAARMDLPWVELLAEDILDRPYWWVAVQDGLRPFRCPVCMKRDERRTTELRLVRDRAMAAADRLQVMLPPSPPYAAAAHVCWRCGAEMLVYAWPGSGGHSVRRPPEPIPRSVEHRATEGAGDYWANCCPTCSAVQGDYYLATGNPDYQMVREHVAAASLSDVW